MNRFFNIAIFGVASVVVANAGPILIGQYAGNSASGVNSGLTSAYITGSAECAGLVVQGNACVAGTKTTETNYQTSVFQGAVPTSTPYAGYSPTSTTPGTTINDGGVTFAMVADTGSATANDWVTPNSLLSIPIGIFDVADVSTMLNDYYGQAGAQDTTVFFNFGSTSNATTGLTVVEVQLTNAGTYGSNTYSGQIRSATTCTAQGTATAGVFTNCSALAGGNLAPTSSATSYILTGATQNESALSGTQGTVTVNTSNVYQQSYTSVPSNEFTGTTGTQQLDAQDFILANLFAGESSDYLVSIGIDDTSFGVPPAGGDQTASLTALSAITVDPAPEPSTWMLFVGGIAAVGVGRLRRLTAK